MAIDAFVEFLPRSFGFGVGSALRGLSGPVGLMLWPSQLGDGSLTPEAELYARQHFGMPYPDVPSAEPSSLWLQQSLMTFPRDGAPTAPFASAAYHMTLVRPGVVELPHPDDLPADVSLPVPAVGLPPTTVGRPHVPDVVGGIAVPWSWDIPDDLGGVHAGAPGITAPVRPVAPPIPLLPRLSVTVAAVKGVPQVRLVGQQPSTAPPERPRKGERKSYDRRAQWVVRRLYGALRGFGVGTELQDFVEAIAWNAYSSRKVTRDGRPVMAMADVRGRAWRGVSGSDAWKGAQVNARSYAYVLQGIASGEYYVDLPGAVSSLIANEVVDRVSGRLARAQGAALDSLVGDRRKFGLLRNPLGGL